MQRSLRLSSVCLYVPRQISKTIIEIGAKFCRLYRTLGSPSKNMTSDFAPEVDKYPQKYSRKSKIAQNSVRAYCLALLPMQLVFHSHRKRVVSVAGWHAWQQLVTWRWHTQPITVSESGSVNRRVNVNWSQRNRTIVTVVCGAGLMQWWRRFSTAEWKPATTTIHNTLGL